jgi:hypothetical protein
LHLRLARLGLLTLLPRLTLRGLPLCLVTLHLAWTLILTLGLVRRLTGGLIATLLVTLGLALLLLHFLARRGLIALGFRRLPLRGLLALWGLPGGLVLLAALGLTLRARLHVLLPALRLATLRGLTLLSLRALARRSAALAAAWHVLG